MVQHAEGVVVDDKPSFKRDMARIDVLRQNFNNLYSIAPGRSLKTDPLTHVEATVNYRAADATLRVLKGNKLDYILLDYVHMTKTYYMRNLLVGPAGTTKEANAGNIDNRIDYQIDYRVDYRVDKCCIVYSTHLTGFNYVRVYNSHKLTRPGDESHASTMLNLLHKIEPEFAEVTTEVAAATEQSKTETADPTEEAKAQEPAAETTEQVETEKSAAEVTAEVETEKPAADAKAEDSGRKFKSRLPKNKRRPRDNAWVLYRAHDPYDAPFVKPSCFIVLARLWQICKNEGLRRYLQPAAVDAVEQVLQVNQVVDKHVD